MLKAGLLIVNNEETLYQFLIAKKDFSDITVWDYMINSEYNGYEQYKRVYVLCKKCGLFNTKVAINTKHGTEYSVVMLVSGYGKRIEKEIRYGIKSERLVLLDKGLNDFVKRSFRHTDINKQAIKYTFNKDMLANDNYREVRELICTDEIKEEFKGILGDSIRALKVYGGYDLVIFSSAQVYDLDDEIYTRINKFIHENYRGKNIAIKRHPQDYVIYNADNVNIGYIPDGIPNSIVIDYVNAPELWVYPSSLLVKPQKDRNISVMNFKHIDNANYKSTIQSVIDSGYNIINID